MPRVELEAGSGTPRAYKPNTELVDEHTRIIDAIIDGDPARAEEAMKVHLEGSLARYRDLLRQANG